MTGVTWDSREMQPGWLYVALSCERVDGHDFVEAALRAGAAGALVMQSPGRAACLLAREMGAAVIEVANTASAVTDLARAWRGYLRGRVIALTGSVGKTTTKNLVRDVCAAYGSVVATRGNQNNELGVPRTLLAADPETAVVVVEMGMRGSGQIAELCDFVRPDWGLVTNVGESHIELLGSRENIARAKAELYAALPAGRGRAFLNLDGAYLDALMEAGGLRERPMLLSGFAGNPDEDLHEMLERDGTVCEEVVWAEDVTLDGEGRARFALCARDHADHEEEALLAPVERCRCALPARRIAVLGDMGELGDFAEACHRGVGAHAAALSLDRLVCVGELSSFIAEGARDAGMDAARISRAATVADVLEELDTLLEPGDAVLVKASHFMGLTRVVEGLVR